jgi:hypothetical protein
MQPTDAFAAISTTDKIASSLYKWITGNRGLKRTVALEMRENIELIRLYIKSGADPKEIIPRLRDDSFRKALASGFNFNALKRSKISSRSTQNVPQLRKYHGWSTQEVFENVNMKVSTLKHANELTVNRKPIRLGVRLHNLFKMMVMLANHIGN